MPDSPRFVLATGLSGAGKSQALRFLEDLGYFCVDNLPVSLIPTFAHLVLNSAHPRKRIAVCVDARAGEELLNLPGYVDEVAELGIRPDTLFMDSSDAVLVHRYSESRRRHPCAPKGSVEEGIRRERELLEPIRARADLVLDTSTMSVSELRERIAAMFSGAKEPQDMVVTVLSFGFKHGVPPEADLVLDVRFLPNPFYDPELRPWTGADPSVRAFVLDNPDAIEFLDRVKGLLKFLLPKYAAEPKSYLTIAVGCTGGRHRSVAVAQELMVFLRDLKQNARLRHRDLDSDAPIRP
ncbi:MAG: RNase adapter RapZ [Candidatus Hydrogenedentes bacterium]|nr:RNase adapter RapZ [Candidatus Hydrogenedentota bacterium]